MAVGLSAKAMVKTAWPAIPEMLACSNVGRLIKALKPFDYRDLHAKLVVQTSAGKVRMKPAIEA